MLRILPHPGNKEIFICREKKYGKVKRAGSCQESNQGHLACAASALPLSYIRQLSNHKPSQQLSVLQDSKHLEWEEKINKKNTAQMCSLLMEMIFRLTPSRVLMAHTEWLLGVRLRHFSNTWVVNTEDCEGWWCHSSVAEHWLHKPGVLGSRPFHWIQYSLW